MTIQKISSAEIADGAVTGPKLGPGAVSSNNFAAGAISSSALSNGSITGDKITVASLAGNVFIANTVTGDKLGQNSISANNIAANAVSITKLSATGVAGSGTFLRGDGAWVAAGGGGLTASVGYNSPGTFTVPSNVNAVQVWVQGGRGGAGNSSPGNTMNPGPGGVAGFGFGIVPVTAGSPYPVTVGAAGSQPGPYNAQAGNPGGSSSFGNLITANGGAGGNGTNPGLAQPGYTGSPGNAVSPTGIGFSEPLVNTPDGYVVVMY